MINPVIREYFRGLRERDELDVIVPELLTGMGFEVISRPMVGTRQYGADVTALGVDGDGVRKLFVFSIKRGDLTRQEWNGASDQALRPSLDEIRDVVLGERTLEHRGLPVVICITLGGVVPENMQRQVNGYIAANAREGLEYQVWSGDTLTTKILDGALREEVFPAELRALLRKAAAMVEEPDISITYFIELVNKVAGSADPVLSRVRILYLALWILFIWGRDGGDLEAAYQASEVVTLRAWELLWREIEADDGQRLEPSHAFFEIVQLHLRIWNELYGIKILPIADARHALSFAVGSVNAVDINLALFETAGRVATGGLWRLWMEGHGPSPRATAENGGHAEAVARRLAVMPAANPTLLSPIADAQGVDLGLALLLLCAVPATREAAKGWIRAASRRIILSYVHHQRYPTVDGDYSNLLRHPVERTPEYREEMTSGSIVMPLLAMAGWAVGDDAVVNEIGRFQREELAHCNFQTWVPNSRTEAGLWHGDRHQGSSLGDLKIGEDGSELIRALRGEASANVDHPALSAIRLEHWPVLLIACRRHRLPVPPQIWMGILDDLRPGDPLQAPEPEAAHDG